jgi:chorismate dehydratase
MRNTSASTQIIYGESSALGEAVQRGRLDAALVPSIEYLRGTGARLVEGPAMVATAADGNILLVARAPVEEIKRVAVGEFCRTPVAILRVVLAGAHDVTPDFLVEKNPAAWRENYDAVLLSGDAALRYCCSDPLAGDTRHNIAGLWHQLTGAPLVTGLWVYNDDALRTELGKTLTTSRNLGMQNLSHLADGIARTSQYESKFLYDYLNTCWAYDMRDAEIAGLRALEEQALRYDLLRHSRLESVTAG